MCFILIRLRKYYIFIALTGSDRLSNDVLNSDIAIKCCAKEFARRCTRSCNIACSPPDYDPDFSATIGLVLNR